MKSFKIAKYEVEDCIPSIRNYYIIFISILTLLALLNVREKGTVASSGLELSTVIFLFVVGLNSFKSSFLFSQSNNISRKTFFKGTIVGIFPMAFLMSIIDIIIKRTYNIFVLCPTNFDMIYGTFRDAGWMDGVLRWSQTNDAGTLFGTFIWQFSLYSMVFIVGIFISMLYYRSNKIMKILISAIPIMLLVFSYSIYSLFPVSFWMAIGNFIANAFGWNSRNPYIAVFSFWVLGAIFSSFSYLLLKKAIVKQ